MIAAARIQAAIEIMDRIGVGIPAEQALTQWARSSRYAGSKDRAAVRDHVFDVLRCRRSFAALGGGETGRCLLLGAQRAAGVDPDTVFTGGAYGPTPLTDAEKAAGREPDPGAAAFDIPEWLWPHFTESLGQKAPDTAAVLQHRAPVHLRVNLRKTDVATAEQALAAEGIVCVRHPASPSALEVVEGARRIRQSAAYTSGQIELQDAASQAVIDALPLTDGMRVLDYCAGGGGKTLAMAARGNIEVFAHDINPGRMRDLPARAARAGVKVTLLDAQAVKEAGPYDIVLCDVPCSGSGAWRRAPEGKWTLTAARLDELSAIQNEILQLAAGFVGPEGTLAYATCSVLQVENQHRIDAFLAEHADFERSFQKAWDICNGTDGFFSAHLTRVIGQG